MQTAAAEAIAELARDNSMVQILVAKAGGIGPLLALLSSRSATTQAHGMIALAQLASRNRENRTRRQLTPSVLVPTIDPRASAP